jgi:hypothetical protein
MLLNLFLNNVWLAISLWFFLYLMDYLLTLKAARMYHTGASKHFKFAGGYELNPFFKEDIAGLRRFSLRFWLLLFFVGGLLLIIHSLDLPEVFAGVWGMFVGIQIAIHFRHIRNRVVFHHARDSEGMSGHIEYEHWLSLRLSSIDLFSFSLLFLFIFLFSGSVVMLGGAAGCLALALRHLIDSAKERKKLRATH